MYSELWQVPFNQATLSGMRKPETLTEITALKAQGVNGIISLLSDQENHALYQQANMDFLWLPMKGGTAPSEWQIDQASDFVIQQLEQQKTIAVHCSNGHKRTGTLLAALLIKNEMSAQTAIDIIIKANPQAQGMNAKQRYFLSAL